MTPLRYALFVTGLMLGFACDVEVEEFEVIEDVEDVDRTALSCSAIKNSKKLCIGQSVCFYTDHHGLAHYRHEPPGGCDPHETKIQTTTVDIACDGASALVTPANCPDGCAGPIKNEDSDASCCTVTSTCYDPPKPAPGDADVVEEG